MKSNGLFDLGGGITTYEIDLMANDMVWNQKSRLYHKIINNNENNENYEKYKSRVDELPNSEEIDFDKNFVII